MNEIINMADRSGNSRHASVEQALRDAIDDIGKRGAFEKGKKVLVLCLDDTDDQYCVSFVQAGMKMSECVTLCDIAKNIFKTEMNY